MFETKITQNEKEKLCNIKLNCAFPQVYGKHQQYKKNDFVKYYCNLKYQFSILIYFKT